MNDTLFKRVTDYFNTNNLDSFPGAYCSELKDAIQSKSAENIFDLYYPALTNFEKVRCTPGHCSLSSYLNATNQDGSKINIYKFSGQCHVSNLHSNIILYPFSGFFINYNRNGWFFIHELYVF